MKRHYLTRCTLIVYDSMIAVFFFFFEKVVQVIMENVIKFYSPGLYLYRGGRTLWLVRARRVYSVLPGKCGSRGGRASLPEPR